MIGFNRSFVFQKCEGILSPEHRKFSVDPQITCFEVLQSILAKAFDIKGYVYLLQYMRCIVLFRVLYCMFG